MSLAISAADSMSSLMQIGEHLYRDTRRSANRNIQPRLVTGLGVGVHRIFCRSLSLRSPSQPARRPIASARLDAAVPIVVLSRRRFAAGVSDPGASDLRGVKEGGGIEVLRPSLPDDRDRNGTPESRFALTRKLFAASLDSLWERRSLELGSAMRNGVAGVGTSAGSSERDSTRGVAFNVPHVISSFTAAGPS